MAPMSDNLVPDENERDIAGYVGLYRITQDGRVFSVRANKFLSPKIDKDGYLEYCLCVNAIRKCVRAHRLVAAAFLDEAAPEKFQINHIDGDKENNHYTNLEWVTCGENNRHAVNTGLRIGVRGEVNNMAKYADSFITSVVEDFVACADIDKTCNVFAFPKDFLESMLGRNSKNIRVKCLDSALWRQGVCIRKIKSVRFNPYVCKDNGEIYFTFRQINNFCGSNYASSVFSRFQNGKGTSCGKKWESIEKDLLIDKVRANDEQLISKILQTDIVVK